MPSTDIVQKLRNYLYDQQFVQPEFERAFEKAKDEAGPLFQQFKIETVEDYLNYYDKLVKWVPTETEDGTFVYNHICMFYFVLGQEPLSGTQNAIRPTTHSPYTWLSQWIIDYAKEVGRWMDTTHSINKTTIKTFDKAKGYNMDDYERPLNDWQTFNEFFARRFKAGRRPIANPDDDTVIVSPADAKFDSAFGVDAYGVCSIKGIPWSIKQLLDEDRDSLVAGSFAGGTFCHSFLAPNDYHRIHAPVSGKVVGATVIEGLCYLEVTYSPETGRLEMCRSMDVVTEPFGLDVPNNAGYQFIQARALILIETVRLGLVAVLPIGMAQVSSVVLSVKAGDKVEKGQELAYFQLGGSDVIMVFQAKANVKFVEKAKHGVHFKYGEHIANAGVKKP